MANTFIIAALACLAAAAPTSTYMPRSAQNGIKLPSTMWLNGEEINLRSPTAALKICDDGDDVVTCARKMAAKWTVNESFLSDHRVMTLDVTSMDYMQGQRPAKVHLDYDISFSNCKLSDPKIVSHQDALYCNADSCEFDMSYTHVSTSTNQYGYRIGSELKASASIGFVTTELTVSGDFNQNWSDSETNSTTVTYKYTLKDNEVCAPTTVQYDIVCDAAVLFNQPSGPSPNNEDIAYVTTDDNIYSGYTHVCSYNNGQAYVAVVGSDQLTEVCNALRNPGTATMDVGSVGSTAAWGLEGCMGM